MPVHFLNMKKYYISALTLLFSYFAYADQGGIYLDATRVVFDSSMSSAKVKLNNKTESNWLLRAWVTQYGLKDKSNEFIITPPLYKIGPNESFQFRIENLDKSLPDDRESVFHVNVMTIPPIAREDKNKNNVVQFSVNNRIKLFYRPSKINNARQVLDAYKRLTASPSKNSVIISNPTPYYITMDDVKINGKDVKSINDFMVAPYSTLTIPEKNAKTLSYTAINDYGGKLPGINIVF
ncbi:TPA: molecular chaperone [Escherichia coli]|uniref:fimbrial biogenesis chaperone n=1 Tax=Escherichia coli TaxID=562 RepID=UPI00201A6ED8|nr:molecular chaperone [Escherichia coli]MDS1658330.1 molecular chaperone [Escherichia coli]